MKGSMMDSMFQSMKLKEFDKYLQKNNDVDMQSNTNSDQNKDEKKIEIQKKNIEKRLVKSNIIQTQNKKKTTKKKEINLIKQPPESLTINKKTPTKNQNNQIEKIIYDKYKQQSYKAIDKHSVFSSNSNESSIKDSEISVQNSKDSEIGSQNSNNNNLNQSNSNKGNHMQQNTNILDEISIEYIYNKKKDFDNSRKFKEEGISTMKNQGNTNNLKSMRFGNTLIPPENISHYNYDETPLTNLDSNNEIPTSNNKHGTNFPQIDFNVGFDQSTNKSAFFKNNLQNMNKTFNKRFNDQTNIGGKKAGDPVKVPKVVPNNIHPNNTNNQGVNDPIEVNQIDPNNIYQNNMPEIDMSNLNIDTFSNKFTPENIAKVKINFKSPENFNLSKININNIGDNIEIDQVENVLFLSMFKEFVKQYATADDVLVAILQQLDFYSKNKKFDNNSIDLLILALQLKINEIEDDNISKIYTDILSILVPNYKNLKIDAKTVINKTNEYTSKFINLQYPLTLKNTTIENIMYKTFNNINNYANANNANDENYLKKISETYIKMLSKINNGIKNIKFTTRARNDQARNDYYNNVNYNNASALNYTFNIPYQQDQGTTIDEFFNKYNYNSAFSRKARKEEGTYRLWENLKHEQEKEQTEIIHFSNDQNNNNYLNHKNLYTMQTKKINNLKLEIVDWHLLPSYNIFNCCRSGQYVN